MYVRTVLQDPGGDSLRGRLGTVEFGCSNYFYLRHQSTNVYIKSTEYSSVLLEYLYTVRYCSVDYTVDDSTP